MLKQILQNDFVVIIDIFPTTASSSDLVTLMDKSDNIVVNYNFCVSLEKCECLEMHIIRKYHYLLLFKIYNAEVTLDIKYAKCSQFLH